MEKVKLTPEQANAIKKWINKELLIIAKASGLFEHSTDESIAELTMEQLVKALYIGYEVEPEFKKGDYVMVKWKNREKEEFYRVVSIDPWGSIQIETLDGVPNVSGHENTRHATPSEIAEEKERRFWNKFGREVNEYRAGDIVKGRGVITEKWRLGPVRKTPELEGAVQIEDISDGNTIDLEMESCRLICPVENRLDR